MHTVNSIGDTLDLRTAAAFVSNMLGSDALDEKTAALIMAAIGESALRPISPEHRDIVRASIFKQILVGILTD